MIHVVQYSGGVGSWAAAKVVAEIKPPEDPLILLFSDTLMEDEDLYRFLHESAANVAGGELVIITEGRDPWQVFRDKRFLGNSRIDPCSYYLKRMFIRAWLEEHCDVESTVCYLGIDWTESHRYTKAARYWEPWRVEAPLVDRIDIDKQKIFDWLEAEGIRRPRLYDMGFAHNNCGGFCVKAGQGHFKLLLEKMPERYAEHESREEEMRQFLDKDVAILTDRRGGGKRPLTLRELRERVEAEQEVDELDIGGCNCIGDDPEVDREIESFDG